MRENRRMREDRRTRRQTNAVFIVICFALLVFSQALTVVLEYFLLRFGIVLDQQLSFIETALIVGGVSVVLGTLLSTVVGRFVLRPFEELLSGMSSLRAGKYEARLKEREGIYHRAYQTFNALACELEKVEILRSDFINNFSHEFKTPLVSMQGLIGLMKNKPLRPEKQKEYLEIIEEEIKHLSLLTTNVLNMSKLDSQSILRDVSEFNIAEQLRTCLLFLEKSWTDKELLLAIDLEEVKLFANEDLLKHVWLNLLDNAIKYSPFGATLGVSLKKSGEGAVVRVQNEGVEIPVEEREKIFSKFYQSDHVGVKKGNGLGLSIVSRIVSLHGGGVRCLREGDCTVFEVFLP